jgi:hypothetical protein
MGIGVDFHCNPEMAMSHGTSCRWMAEGVYLPTHRAKRPCSKSVLITCFSSQATQNAGNISIINTALLVRRFRLGCAPP